MLIPFELLCAVISVSFYYFYFITENEAFYYSLFTLATSYFIDYIYYHWMIR